MSTEKEALARQIAIQMKKDPDEIITLPGGREVVLWKLIEETMGRIATPSLRTLLAARGETKTDGLKVKLGRLFRKVFRRKGGWIHPADSLPPIRCEGSVLSRECLIKRNGVVMHARLMYGTPIGSHRWVTQTQDETTYIHVMEIDGWMAIPQ